MVHFRLIQHINLNLSKNCLSPSSYSLCLPQLLLVCLFVIYFGTSDPGRMDLQRILTDDTQIPQLCISNIRKSHFACLVPDAWLNALHSKRHTPLSEYSYSSLEDPHHLVATSTTRLPAGWTRVIIQVIAKSDDTVTSLVEESLCEAPSQLCMKEMMSKVTERVHRGQWIKARKLYNCAVWPVPDSQTQLPLKSWTIIVHTILKKLYHCPVIQVNQDPRNRPRQSDARYGHTNPLDSPHAGLLNAHAILEYDNAFYAILPFQPHTLWDSVVFSPAMLQQSSIKAVFVFYQILQAVLYCHSQGVAIGNLQLQDFCIDNKGWVRLTHPQLIYSLCEELRISCSDNNVEHTEDLVMSTSNTVEQLQNGFDAFTDSHKLDDKHSGNCSDTNSGIVGSLEPSSIEFKNLNTGETIPREISGDLNDLPNLVQQWMLGKLSNYDYLMVLNHLAGRRMYDPNHHPILPWVMNFKSPNGGFRDLTKSKYRLNKGDHQLDVTYNPEDPHKDPLQVPHHIAEVLSDITYYVYKARRIPKSVLCTHVRQRWVPHEYPSSMERMQQWTPDECIPEFFTDPTIFKSIHEDLPDLEVPPWVNSPEDFIEKHMAILESDHVSQRLHHWIDLTFGYKLSGSSSVKAKNVCLQLVDQHTNLVNHGVVQLFHHAHPPRVVPGQADRFTGHSPRKSTQKNTATDDNAPNIVNSDPSSDSTDKNPEPVISLPHGYQPLAALNHLEALYEFCVRVAGTIPEPLEEESLPKLSPQQRLVAMDMQVLGCLLVELFLSAHTRALGYGSSLAQRYNACTKVCFSHWHLIPRMFHQSVELLLGLKKTHDSTEQDSYGAMFLYDPVSELGHPPPDVSQLLHPAFSPIHFPSYFPALYWVLHKLQHMEEMENSLEARDMPVIDKIYQLKLLHKQKVAVLRRFIQRRSRQLGSEGIQLVLPYVIQLLESPVTSVQAAWALFNPVAQLLGTEDKEKYFLHLLKNMFDTEQTTPAYIKIYHRSFVIQLVVRLGLETFLNHFLTSLIEAVGSYKDFTDEDVINRQISHDAEAMMHKGLLDTSCTSDTPTKERKKSEISLDIVGEALLYEFEDEPDSEVNADDVFKEDLMFELDENQELKDTNEADDVESSENPEHDIDDDNDNGEDAGDEMLGKSTGRFSVHSVSRLVMGDSGEPSEEESDSSSLTQGEDDDQEEVQETHRTTVQTDRESTPDDAPDSTASHTTPLSPAVGNPDPSSLSKPEPEASPPSPASVRRETEDLASFLSSSQDLNISDVSSETIKWLAHRLGPVLTAKHLSRNLLRMLMLCYMGKEQLSMVEREGEDYVSTTQYQLMGDVHAAKVLDCLSFIAILYGEQVILLQYFQHARELIQSAMKKLSLHSEAGLISCVSLLVHVIPYLSDATLMTVLQDTILGDLVLQVMKLVSSSVISFPTGSRSRSAICHKIVDVLYIISLRIGFEMTRENMTYALQKFFAAFSRIYDDNTAQAESEETGNLENAAEDGENKKQEATYYELKVDTGTHEYRIHSPGGSLSPRYRLQGSLQYMLSPTADDNHDDGVMTEKTKDSIMQELKETFTPELAHTAYIPFCKLAGGIHLEQNLINEELIRNLCMIHDQTLQSQTTASSPISTSENTGPPSPFDSDPNVTGSFGSNVSFSGNKITLQDDASLMTSSLGVTRSRQATRRKSGDERQQKLRSEEMKIHSDRHLKGDWLAYWEHEVGLSDRESHFNFKQIKLQTFSGHTSSVRAIQVLDNENSFLTASKDKTVKLWSLRNWGDGQSREAAKFTYTGHKRSVFAVSFLETTHQVASCDSNIHIWDPFLERTVAMVDAPKSNPVTAMVVVSVPNPNILTAASDCVLRFLDARTGRFSHEYKCTTSPAGVVRCLGVSPGGHTVAVGYSSGVISTLDVRTGALLASWKGHEGEILQIKCPSSGKIVTSCFDQTMAVWSIGGDKIVPLKGPTEPVHCFTFYKDSLISATTANRVGIHLSFDKKASFICSKLRTDIFKGVLTTLTVLPLNRLLLLGSDTGDIHLAA